MEGLIRIAQVNRKGKRQERVILLTNLAVYNFKACVRAKVGAASSRVGLAVQVGSYVSFKRRIPLHDLGYATALESVRVEATLGGACRPQALCGHHGQRRVRFEGIIGGSAPAPAAICFRRGCSLVVLMRI